MHISPAYTRLSACRPGTNDVLHGGAKAERQDINVILLASAGAWPTIDLQVRIYCHPNISFHANVPTSTTRGDLFVLRGPHCPHDPPRRSLTLPGRSGKFCHQPQ